MRSSWALALVFGALCACGGQLVGGGDGGSSFTAVTLKEGQVDKLDVLFAIDNSSSMADKQDLLADAIPAFFSRLLNPDCVDASGGHVAGDNAACKTIPGTRPEFPPVHDMHVGIVSSSLGGGGSPDVCVVSGADTTHDDDKGHLLNRTLANNTDGPPIANAKPLDGNGGNFLAWLPANDPKNAGKAPPNVTPYSEGQQNQLATDFGSLVLGVQQHGCGLEAQLESWYRFLIQPDPYDSIQGGGTGPVTLVGVDATLLKMRHDFLRPDSVVAIIQLTDEEDSWSDPMWKGGYGWAARTALFPGGPGAGAGPRGTSECADPNNPDCTSCAFAANGVTKPVSGKPIQDDPNCNSCAPGATTCPQKGWYTPASPSAPITAADGLNVRYGSQYMKARYGLDPQWPVARYVDGLTKTTVPDRDHEHPVTTNCTNPLYADSLPDGSDTSAGALCSLKLGSRTPDMVFYALLGGVPNELVANAQLGSSDWVKIVGNDPDHFDFSGIDPHMIESIAPRAGLPAPGATYNLGVDPDNGREWNTLTAAAGIDLQYACTFLLPAPKDCTAAANAAACDCTGNSAIAPDGPPVCDPQVRTTQMKGKAYPTIRELRVARALGANAVVASLCAADTSPADVGLPTYGYRPAMNAIVDRLAGAMNGNCFPTPLSQNADGTVSCQVLAIYGNQSDQAAGCTDSGMSQPSAGVLSAFDSQWTASGGTGPAPVVCIYKQLMEAIDYEGPSCQGASNAGWCYVVGAANTGGCAQSIVFSGSGPPAGVSLDLECTQ